ncbi:unnamed protein product [Lymnaea stagnalis]|uniref:Cation-dependent mannose-6-phosphate receptor n=1 Tax=Lymnaea stagnalis TaxID=6523 RepID=A0AAV2HSQ1_LYMST
MVLPSFHDAITKWILLSSVVLCPVVARECVKVDACSCKYDDDIGAVVNLRPLASSNGNPLFLDHAGKDGAFYSYNPCLPFNEGQCKDSAICKRDGANGTTTSLADQSKVSFHASEAGRKIEVSYPSPSGLGIMSFFTYTCLEQQDPPLFTAFGYDNISRQYHFQVDTKCACDNGCYVAPDSGGLSAGSVLLIVFFVLVFVYLVVGFIHGNVSRSMSGREALPHYDFWVGFPGLVKEGCFFTFRCGSRTSVQTYDEV